MNRLKVIIGLAIACIPVVLQAQKKLSLQESLEYGLLHNPNVAIAQYDVDNARYRNREGYGTYLPQINGSFTLDDNLKLPVTVIPAGAFPGSTEDSYLRFGLQYNAQAVLQLDQTIYDQSKITGFKAYKPAVQLSEQQKKAQEEDIAYNIAVSYMQILVLKEQIKMLDNNLESYSQLLKITDLQKQKGVITEVDYNRLRINVANIESQLSWAKSNMKVAENNLKIHMGLPLETLIELTDTNNVDNVADQAAGVAPFNVNNRTEVQILEKSLFLQEIQWKMMKHTYVPTLGFYARYGGMAYNNDFGRIWKSDQWFDFATIGIKVSVPIFDGMVRLNKAKQQKMTVMKERKQLELYKMQFQLQYDNAMVQNERSKNNVINDKNNLDLSEQVFQQTSLQYEKGVANLSDLVNVENARKDALTNYINSLLNLRISQLELEKANGNILNFLGIKK